jgi:hypothetical protein
MISATQSRPTRQRETRPPKVYEAITVPPSTCDTRELANGHVDVIRNFTSGAAGDPGIAITNIGSGLYPNVARLITATGDADANGNWPLWVTNVSGTFGMFLGTATAGSTSWTGSGTTLSNTSWATHELAIGSTYAPYDNVGMANDGQTSTVSFDGGGGAGNSYSAQAMANAAINPSATSACPWAACAPGVAGGQWLITGGGDVFTMAPFTPGTVNNWQAAGQNVPAPVDSNGTFADHIAFLGAGTQSPSTGSTGTATITYTDGHTQQVPIVLSDWTLNSNTFTPAGGNTIMATGAYRDGPTGAPDQHSTYLFATVDTQLRDNGQTLQAAGQQIASITLPSNSNLHIFAIAVN